MIWHVYGGVVPSGPTKGCWLTITIELAAPQEMLYEYRGYPYLQSFDHNPTGEEMDLLHDTFCPPSGLDDHSGG